MVWMDVFLVRQERRAKNARRRLARTAARRRDACRAPRAEEPGQHVLHEQSAADPAPPPELPPRRLLRPDRSAAGRDSSRRRATRRGGQGDGHGAGASAPLLRAGARRGGWRLRSRHRAAHRLLRLGPARGQRAAGRAGVWPHAERGAADLDARARRGRRRCRALRGADDLDRPVHASRLPLDQARALPRPAAPGRGLPQPARLAAPLRARGAARRAQPVQHTAARARAAGRAPRHPLLAAAARAAAPPEAL